MSHAANIAIPALAALVPVMYKLSPSRETNAILTGVAVGAASWAAFRALGDPEAGVKGILIAALVAELAVAGKDFTFAGLFLFLFVYSHVTEKHH